ncbi:hypothetical protein [Streptosporangium sp. OZ121]|uniref:hypothetical protein n=1 Tax=Streptosporangium sp. OZ121 TaxID=3444183 RepID=UPI003F7A4648
MAKTRPQPRHRDPLPAHRLDALTGRSHLMPAQQSWEEIAGHALNQALDHS